MDRDKAIHEPLTARRYSHHKLRQHAKTPACQDLDQVLVRGIASALRVDRSEARLDPPYEDEPDFAAAPPHFDGSAQIKCYWDPDDKICQGDEEPFSDEFGATTHQHIALVRAITKSARMKNPNNPAPSQPFFQVMVRAGPHEWESIYRTAIDLINKHFPEKSHPRSKYVYLVTPRIRFFANDCVAFSTAAQSSNASSNSANSQNQPTAVVSTP
ncbi:hypothetical protein CLAFUW4_12779 [Fulvia fulva]|uniref:Uncharacterized protein n=1 Tax=Passalora fulva TaxID=5499 RepID=A0A9Q8UVC3_PASFU|nr:uncharacterized protein CLAFUR5_12646 [Fulvia fulva]KAK4611660.1 hypothetical protein CLAFUR4_12783 [Fulvia fulva]KAK4612857.1 hypothetical protein CLAFUR0_12789 [Fulvia fulva]UJO23755.1 hypothetical protein CLAFUR5_12646 [Fulvia fulva]WPV21096.1 hypothetical protein CLAFUW4_12779 [Fulvia fulva]WPV36319.1 hypothetical protein CLAFUW7_12786 [Fulvia fulva]